jgi:hypothetical protein
VLPFSVVHSAYAIFAYFIAHFSVFTVPRKIKEEKKKKDRERQNLARAKMNSSLAGTELQNYECAKYAKRR